MVVAIKSDWSEEPFSIEKVRKSIEKAAIDADVKLTEFAGEIRKITEEVAEKAKKMGKITTAEIRTLVLDRLDKVKKSVADAWRNFEEKYIPSSGGGEAAAS